MKDLIKKIQDYVVKNSHSTDFELSINYTEDRNTRFAQNAISQHISGTNMDIRYSASFDNKSGSCTINQFDEESLKYLIHTAEQIALLNQPDPEFSPSLGNLPYIATNNVVEDTRNYSPQNIVNTIKELIAQAESKGTNLSGIFTKGYNYNSLLTKNGFCGEYDMCDFELSMTIKKDNVETKTLFSHKDIHKLNVKNEWDRLYQQYLSLGDPQSMDAEALPVILRPQATANFLMYLYWIMNRKMADDGLTPFTGQIGNEFFGDNFSMLSVSDDPELSITPFTSNWIYEPTAWVKNGVLNSLPCDKSYAQKLKIKPSGFANIYIDGGKTTEEEMMQSVKRGLIINDFWYIRPNDMKTADFTGMTRDGVNYFENGTVVKAVNNFRFNESLVDVTRRILALGESTLISPFSKVPTMLIDRFNFVDKTSF